MSLGHVMLEYEEATRPQSVEKTLDNHRIANRNPCVTQYDEMPLLTSKIEVLPSLKHRLDLHPGTMGRRTGTI